MAQFGQPAEGSVKVDWAAPETFTSQTLFRGADGPLFQNIVPPVIRAGHLRGNCLSPSETEHKIYFEERGRFDGAPLLVLHGGPGNPIPTEALGILGSENLRSVICHQRGSGQSLPHGEMNGNSLAHLIDDLESLRATLGIERWHVFGWSWGSTLGLVYAENFPDRLLSFTGFGTFLGTKPERDYLLAQIKASDPETFETYMRISPPETMRNHAEGFLKMLKGPEADVAIRAWFEIAADREIPDALRRRANVSITYSANGFFLEEDQIAKNSAVLKDIPMMLIHGARDPYCPLETVGRLKTLIGNNVSSHIIEQGSHSLSESAVQQVLFDHFSTLSGY